MAYSLLGEYPKALKINEEALQKAEAAHGETPGWADFGRMVALAERRAGEADGSQDIGKSICRHFGPPPGLICCTWSIGDAASSMPDGRSFGGDLRGYRYAPAAIGRGQERTRK